MWSFMSLSWNLFTLVVTLMQWGYFWISYKQIILFLLTCSCEFNFCILVFENIGCICWVLRNNIFYDHFVWQFSCASLFNSFVSLKYVGTWLEIMRNDSYFCWNWNNMVLCKNNIFDLYQFLTEFYIWRMNKKLMLCAFIV